MIAIFCVVFAILAISMYLMCRFMNKNKDEDNKRSRREARHRRERRDDYDEDEDDVDHQRVRHNKNNEDNYVRESDNESASIPKQYRVPIKQRNTTNLKKSQDSSSKNDGSNHKLFGENSSAVFGDYDNNSGLNERLLNYSDGTGSQGSK